MTTPAEALALPVLSELPPPTRPADALTLAHQKADFTAEGAPPPGRTGRTVPRRSGAETAPAARGRRAR